MLPLPLGFEIAVSMISIMIAIGGIVLGLGYALNEKRLKEFGKSEIIQSVFNGILVGSLLALFSANGLITQTINSATLSNGASIQCSAFMAGNAAICLAYDYLVGSGSFTFMGVTHYSVLSMVTSFITALFGLNALLGIIASVKITLVFVTFSLEYAISPIISEIQYLIKILSTVAISAAVQASVLVFISVCTLNLILPSGIVLRTFYPTRKLGGFLIALSIGLYAVLPLSYLFNISLANSYYANVNSTSIDQVTLTASQLQNNLLSVSPITNSSKSTGIIGSLSGLVSSLTDSVSSMINKLTNYIAYFIVYTFVLPVFSLILTGISVRELAEILGSEAFFGKFNIL